LAKRRDVDGRDNCLACHMPPQATDVRHAAVTDHRVPRFAVAREDDRARELPGSRASGDSLAALPIVALPPRSADVDVVERARDAAVALIQASLYHPRRIMPFHYESLLDPLRQAVIRDPGDVEALETLAEFQARLGNPREATALYRQALDKRPGREHSLVMLARLLAETGTPTEAVDAWQRAVEINPWMVRCLVELGRAYARDAQWSACRRLVETGLTRFADSVELRQLLIECQLRAGESTAAAAELRTLLELRPAESDAIQQWFDSRAPREAP
jgi:tetratricopeptide (TPR) repeat protein